jgi:hypothetical protein
MAFSLLFAVYLLTLNFINFYCDTNYRNRYSDFKKKLSIFSSTEKKRQINDNILAWYVHNMSRSIIYSLAIDARKYDVNSELFSKFPTFFFFNEIEVCNNWRNYFVLRCNCQSGWLSRGVNYWSDPTG